MPIDSLKLLPLPFFEGGGPTVIIRNTFVDVAAEDSEPPGLVRSGSCPAQLSCLKLPCAQRNAQAKLSISQRTDQESSLGNAETASSEGDSALANTAARVDPPDWVDSSSSSEDEDDELVGALTRAVTQRSLSNSPWKFAARGSHKELEDLREQCRQLKDRNLQLQSEVSTIQKERTTIAQELETVKANFKQHLTNKRAAQGGGGGNEAELERSLAEAKEALEAKERECETMKKDLDRRLGDSKQFQDLKTLLKKKTDEVKDLKQQLSKAGAAKKEDNDGCVELEADSD